MRNTIFYLSTCDTCKKILKESGATMHDFVMQDIKVAPMTAVQLDALRKMSGSYASLFSKRAQLYKSLNLASKILTEDDYKRYLLEHYTFLKRPVVVYNNQLFAGSDKPVVAALANALAKK